jgi:hypothetical protein
MGVWLISAIRMRQAQTFKQPVKRTAFSKETWLATENIGIRWVSRACHA